MGWLATIFGITDKVQPVSINDSNFEEEVLRSNLPVLLDVWTPTCVHCHKLEPIIMSLATKYQGKLKVAEINGAEAPRAMTSLSVRGTPTVIYFFKGEEVERIVGFKGSLYHQEYIEKELLPLVEDTSGSTSASAPEAS
jgi:thioredoxin 1